MQTISNNRSSLSAMFIQCFRHRFDAARYILSRTVTLGENYIRNEYSDVLPQLSFCRHLHSRKLEPICSNVWNIQFHFNRYAGHSHWQNIRHIKGAKDAEKQKQITYILSRLRIAVKEGGSCDPRLNTKVASILDEGKSKGIPKSTLTEYLKKLDDKSNYKIHTIEAKGPGQSLFMFEVFTDKPGVLEGMIQGILKKNQGRVGNKKGFASYGFNHRGFLTVPATEGTTLDQMTDIAIECEAEDVTEITEEGEIHFQLSCPAEDVYKIKGKLEKADVAVGRAYTTWEPKTRVILTASDKELVDRIFAKLDGVEDIEEIYDNLETS